MEPKKYSQALDPKFKEIYDRVMGTSVTPSIKPQETTPPKPVSPTVPVKSIQPEPFLSKPFAKSDLASVASNETFAKTVSVSQNQPQRTKKNIKLYILIILGGLIFFVLYTFIWIKLFNLKLPFLPV